MRLLLVALTVSLPAMAQGESSDEPVPELIGLEALEEDAELETLQVVGNADEITSTAGSAHAISERDLERFEDDDAHRVLLRVPGVYVRDEDGLGLRPNIGMRGANSDRSKKITLMEDGVLFAPAPYSAPAAYYFPMITRMTEVRVYKGPSSILYGPHTVGGALDVRTRDIPHGTGGGVDVAFGQFLYGKLHGHFGASGRNAGFLAEAVRVQTHGFKQLDDGADTGFAKNEFMIKGRLNTDAGRDDYHQLEVKLGLATESSNETYLGLTDPDFRAASNRRYAASQRDVFEWTRTQLQVSHHADFGDGLSLTTTVYRHDLDRTWQRLNRFQGTDLFTVLTNPDATRNQGFLGILRGEADSTTPEETLLVATNDRTFMAQGVQLAGEWITQRSGLENRLQHGVRYHNDRIIRAHTEDPYEMRSSVLVRGDGPTAEVARSVGAAHAVAVHVMDELTLGPVLLAPGARVELVQTHFDDELRGQSQSSSQEAIIPGVGASVEVWPDLRVLAGVHRGFSPATPSLTREIEPEFSVNYEAGARYAKSGLRADVIGFLNDYDNLLADCSPTECPLNPDGQVNAGGARILGAEAYASHELQIGSAWRIHAQLAYTYTRTELLNAFRSENPQLGNVRPGDELPYVPEHQGALVLGLEAGRFGINQSTTYVGAMREEAGQGPDGLRTDEAFLVDLMGKFAIFDGAQLYAKLDNVLGAEYIASRRPFGARPGRPRWAQVGFKYAF
jgi:Fe(3+) dicitrate transport protein